MSDFRSSELYYARFSLTVRGQRLSGIHEAVGRPVFPTKDLTSHTKNIQKALTGAVHRSGITRNGEPLKLTVKMIRKFYVTYQRSQGVMMENIREMIGHSPQSRVTDKHYLHIPDQTVRTAVLDLDSGTVAKELATEG